MSNELLLLALRGTDRKEIADAAVELGKRRAVEAVPYLIKLLSDRSRAAGLAVVAAQALGAIQDVCVLPELLALLDDDLLGNASEEALASFDQPEIDLALAEKFRRRPRSRLATLLGNRGSLTAVDALIGGLASPESHVRFYSARALGKIADVRALPFLEEVALRDTSIIDDSRSLYGRSVSDAARASIEKIRNRVAG